MMFSLQGYMMGRDKEYPPTPDMLAGGNNLLNKVEAFLYDCGVDATDEDISSGYRPGHFNEAAGGSPNSAHKLMLAIDLKKRVRDAVLILGLDRVKELLEKHGLYMEHPKRTLTWLHLQTRATRNRIFIP